MDNTIDVDHATGLAFKLAHRMRAAQVAAGWDSWQKCFKPNENQQQILRNRIRLFVEFLVTPDEKGLSSYTLRCDALETSLIAMEGIIARTRISFQAQHGGAITDSERAFLRKTKDHMTGTQVCNDARIILEQMMDVQVQLLNSAERTQKVKP